MLTFPQRYLSMKKKKSKGKFSQRDFLVKKKKSSDNESSQLSVPNILSYREFEEKVLSSKKVNLCFLDGYLTWNQQLVPGITSFRCDHFRRHLFRCCTFSAQIVSAPIRCSLTVHLIRVWVRALG